MNTVLQAITTAMNAGCDQEGGGILYYNLSQAVSQGLVSVDTINESFRRLFRVRTSLGMFDPPTMVSYNFLVNSTEVVESLEHTQLARDVARESIVLYKNNNVLPLGQITSIAVIGPAAPQELLLLGNYNGYPTTIISILEGISAAMNFTERSKYAIIVPTYFSNGRVMHF